MDSQSQRTRSSNSPYFVTFLVALLATPSFGEGMVTAEPAQVRGDTASTNHEFSPQALFTVGETIGGYRPIGNLDGMGAMPWTQNIVRVFVNHEAGAPQGEAYALSNGLMIRGARVSFFDLEAMTRKIVGAGPAYNAIVDRAGAPVESATQINEGSSPIEGFERFCSGSLYRKNQYGLADDIYFCGEETHGGQLCALDVHGGTMYVVPQFGRQAFENVAFVDNPDPHRVAACSGDDREGAPLWLYIGNRNAAGDGSFLDRNGLAKGMLFVWKADNGDVTPEQFHGTGSVRSGTFVRVIQYDASKAGQAGWDALGYATQENLDAQADTGGAFHFSRPEDFATNPNDGSEIAFASTGGSTFDNWGDIFVVRVDFSGSSPRASLRIAYDGDDAGAGRFAGPDFGVRSPDNLGWSQDGFLYVQENAATSPRSLFGEASGIEASTWKLDPESGVAIRIAVIDRAAVPSGQIDSHPEVFGIWEASGVIDVTSFFFHAPGETVLLTDTQAPSLVGPPLGGSEQSHTLVEGGQLLVLSTALPTIALDGPENEGAGEANLHVRAIRNLISWSPAVFELSLPADSRVACRVYDVSGRTVRTIFNQPMPLGTSTFEWFGDNDNGTFVPSGIYFARIESDRQQCGARILVVR